MQKVTISRVDDLDGTEATETVRFGLDGKWYEGDFSDANAKDLREGLAEFINVGRKIASNGSARPKGSAKADREQTQAIREWARGEGYSVSERGRIPAQILEAYNNAHAN